MGTWCPGRHRVAFAGSPCRRGRLDRGRAGDRTRGREPFAGRRRRRPRVRRARQRFRPECPGPGPSASRTCRPLRPGGRRCVFAGPWRHGPTCRCLRRRLSCRAVGRGKSADASRSGPGHPVATAAGWRAAWRLRSSGIDSVSIRLLDGPYCFLLCSAFGDGRSAPGLPTASCPLSPPWLHAVR